MRTCVLLNNCSIRGQWQIDCAGAFEPLVSAETFQLVELTLKGKRPTVNLAYAAILIFRFVILSLVGSVAVRLRAVGRGDEPNVMRITIVSIIRAKRRTFQRAKWKPRFSI